MKKYLSILTSSLTFLSIVTPALAAPGTKIDDPCTNSGSFDVLCTLTVANMGKLVGSLIQLVFVAAVLIALFYLVYGGFRWLVSSGDKAQVASAREHLVAAIIGLVIIFLSYFIINLLLYFFGLGSLNALVIPTLE